MGIAGTNLGAIIGSQIGANTDWQQPNAGGGGGGSSATPFDLTTLTAAEDSHYQVRTHQSVPLAVAFSSDGTKMAVLGQGADTMTTWTLPTAWDLSSIVAAPENTGIDLADAQPRGMWWNSDGTRMYWVGDQTPQVWYAEFSTPWDASTKGTATGSGTLAAYMSQPSTIMFNEDGTAFYVMEYPANYLIHEFSCDGDAYDTSSGNWTYVGSIDITTRISTEYPTGLWINGTQVFISTQSKNIHEFSFDGTAISSLSATAVQTQAYTQSQAGSWGLWMGADYIGYVTGGLDYAVLHAWGPHE